MTDRELLELAAKAAGHTTRSDRLDVWIVEDDGSPVERWNPLQDDGQVLRLAVSLGIDMYFWVSGVEAQHSDIPQQPIQHYKGDRAAATRRAVTLVAAEIGKTRSD
ncbi:hypothetical protein KYT87_09285 [Achromobacter sp. ES-001]|uniref:hypothetical protein n=1 Tax=Achromobacter sp. ES-001 TaxID=2860286 RepID=UPI001C63F737|nr:hypothetical protein [Achromobacter sp. ES-001]QYJ23386.1 hypothetical protein KYT87_09285 [Achromobacter sp. ES-001]